MTRKFNLIRCLLQIVIPISITPLSLWTQPLSPDVTAGEAAFVENGNFLKITTTEMKTIIHWDAFSIAKEETTHFDQIDPKAITLNRVSSSLGSEIFGTLSSNGSLYLINPNGILIAESGVIDVNGLVASTLDLQDADFLSKEALLFSGMSKAAIENRGLIESGSGGVFLLGRYIINRGDIVALTGKAEIGAGSQVWLKTKTGGIVIEPQIESDATGIGIDQSGQIRAGQVDLRADGDLYTLAIRQTGSINAMAIEELGGEVYLVAEGGSAVLRGEASILSQGKEGEGGSAYILGKEIELFDQANITTENDGGGGFIGIGSDRGAEDQSAMRAATVMVEKGVVLNASGGVSGNGGEILIFGTSMAKFEGVALAKGGALKGDGGCVEISQYPVFHGVVDTTAPLGQTGTLILDPASITISGGPTSGGSFDGGSPTNTFSGSGSVTLNNSDLNTALQTNNVLVTTGSISGDITIGATTTLTLLTESHTLTLNAGTGITVDFPFTMTDLADGTSTLNFISGGNINLNSSVTGTNLAAINMTANSGTLVLDNTLSGLGATITLLALDITSAGGGTNALLANQCTIGATNDITITNDINFTGGGSGSSISLAAGNAFNHNNLMRFSDWGSALLSTTSGNYVMDSGITATNVDAVTINSGQDLINQGGTNLLNDVTGQKAALTMTASNDVTINSQIDINNFLSCSITATNDFVLNSDFEPDNTTTVTVTAGNDILMTNSAADVIANDGETLSFLAGNNFTLGEPFVANNFEEVNITATNGTLDLGTGSAFTLSGIGAINITAESGALNVGPGAVFAIGGTGETNFTATNGNVNVEESVIVNNATGNIYLIAGTDVNVGSNTATAVSHVGTRNGRVIVIAGRDLNVIGGAGSSDRSQIGFSLGSSVNSDIELTVGRDINVTAGASSNSVALIGHGFSNINGTYAGDIIFHSVGGDVVLTGDTGAAGSVKYAQIGHARIAGSNTVTFSGDIRGETEGSFAVIDGTLRVLGGNDTESYALFGHGGQDSNASETYSGAIRVQANAIELIGGTNSDCESAIGFFATAQGGGSNSVVIGPSATVEVISDTTVTMTGNTNGTVSIGARVLESAAHPVSIALDLVRVETGDDLTLTSGSGIETGALIGALTDNHSAVTNITLDVGGDLSLNSGAGASAQIVNGNGSTTAATTTTIQVAGDVIPTASGAFLAKIEAVTGDLFVTALGTLTLPSSTLIENLGNTDGTVRVRAGEILAQDGGLIRNSGSGTTKITTTSGGLFLLDSSFVASIGALTCSTATDFNLLNDASFQTTAGTINVTVGGSLSITGATTGASFCRSSGQGKYVVGKNIFLQGTSVFNEGYIENDTGNLELIAAENIEINPFGRIETLGLGDVTLVVDNQAPQVPSIGEGAFGLSSFGFVATGGGPLRIFTAKRSQNVINGAGNLNGATFVPGTLFVNTTTEKWSTYFPSSFGGEPFTIFYKNGATAPLPTITTLLTVDPNALTPFFELFYLLEESDMDPVVAWLYTLPVNASKLCEADPIASQKLPPYIEKLSLTDQ